VQRKPSASREPVASRSGRCEGALTAANGAISTATVAAVAPTIATGCTSCTRRLTYQALTP
jgi:hypothetical protein